MTIIISYPTSPSGVTVLLKSKKKKKENKNKPKITYTLIILVEHSIMTKPMKILKLTQFINYAVYSKTIYPSLKAKLT